MWSCLEYRLEDGVSTALDDHWALRSDGSDVRITPRIAIGDDHGSIHKPAVSGTPAAVAAWLIEQLQTPISNGGFQYDRSNSLADVASGGIVSADFNKDGLKDVALALSNGQVAVLKGSSGGGALLSAPSYFSVGAEVTQIVAFDGDRDDKVDLVLVGENEVQIWHGQGDGNFTDKVTLDQWGSDFPVSVATADLTGDEHPDLVVLTDGCELFLLEGGGASRFWNSPVSLGFLPGASGANGLALYMEDLDDDGVCDLLASNIDSGSSSNVFFAVGSRLGNGSTTFSLGSASQILDDREKDGTFPLNVGVADFDGDDNRDIVTLSGGIASEAVFFFNDGAGSFGNSVYKEGDLPQSVHALAWADCDGDGYLDVLAARGTSVVFYRRGHQSNGLLLDYYEEGLSGFSPFSSVVLGDFNGDGHLDFASAGGADNRLATYRGGVYDGPGSGDGGDLDEIIPKPRR
ncbi:MAG: VCBS repeat-containing protein [bacterium]|nr:VCBS repeat-containing protein [bacterium]